MHRMVAGANNVGHLRCTDLFYAVGCMKNTAQYNLLLHCVMETETEAAEADQLLQQLYIKQEICSVKLRVCSMKLLHF